MIITTSDTHIAIMTPLVGVLDYSFHAYKPQFRAYGKAASTNGKVGSGWMDGWMDGCHLYREIT